MISLLALTQRREEQEQLSIFVIWLGFFWSPFESYGIVNQNDVKEDQSLSQYLGGCSHDWRTDAVHCTFSCSDWPVQPSTLWTHSPERGGNSLWSLTYLRAETEVSILSRKKKNFAKYCRVWSGTTYGYIKDNELNLFCFVFFFNCVILMYTFVFEGGKKKCLR